MSSPLPAFLINMYYTLACLSCALLCVCALSWLYGRRARGCLAGLPGYPALPLLGNVLMIAGGREKLYHVIVDISNKIEEHQKPLVFWFGPLPILIVSNPDDVKLVTNAYVEKPFFYNFGRIYVGDGLVTASASIWRRNIKKLAGTFVGPIVDGYQDVFNAQAQKLVDNLKREVGGEPFDIMKKYLAFATLETICQTALGFPSISKNLVTTEYYVAFTRTLELLIERGINPLLHPNWLYKMTPAYREIVKCVGKLQDVSRTVIVKRKREYTEMKQKGTFEEHKADNGRTRFRSFLDILLELSETDPSMTEEQMQAEVDTIIVGGQETTATTLMYTILALGSSARVQDKLCAELKSIFGDSKRPVEKEDLVRMTYCEAVIYESLRLYPPVPAVLRDASHDLKLSSCTIPKGTPCVVNAYGAGRSRRSWGPDVHEFKPERWLDGSSVPAAAFLPFSYGKRSCIGKRYAMAILKTILAYCLREYVFISDVDQLKYKVDIALKPISGHFVQVRHRK